VLAHPGIFAPRYSFREGVCRSVGVPYAEDFLIGMGASFSYSNAFRELVPGIFLTGEVPRLTPFEQGDSGLFCDLLGSRRDHVPDDQSLAIATEKGLVLLLGCCHAGVVNTVEHVRQKCGVDELYAVIGGCHLAFSSPEQTESTVKALSRYGVKKICAGHCTGFDASARFARAFGGGFRPAHVGYTLEFKSVRS
jgi:7,8-dihydropterin-6-yl-methyl-4-(beta-D-ribofuranosyl)aminobenzene 5'-phosphate synthase